MFHDVMCNAENETESQLGGEKSNYLEKLIHI